LAIGFWQNQKQNQRQKLTTDYADKRGSKIGSKRIGKNAEADYYSVEHFVPEKSLCCSGFHRIFKPATLRARKII
jgi:hypothetical protein